jgi:hypothetical protein
VVEHLPSNLKTSNKRAAFLGSCGSTAFFPGPFASGILCVLFPRAQTPFNQLKSNLALGHVKKTNTASHIILKTQKTIVQPQEELGLQLFQDGLKQWGST